MSRRPFSLVLLLFLLVGVTTRGYSMIGNRAEEAIRAHGLRVQLSGGPGDIEDDWRQVSGGGFEAEVTQTAHGTDQHSAPTVGRISFEPLTISGDIKSGRQGWFDWLRQTLEGQGQWERSVTLTELRQDGSDAATFTYSDCFITRYVFPKLDARSDDEPATESFVLQPNGYDFTATRALADQARDRAFRSDFQVDIAGASEASSHVTSVEMGDLVIEPVPTSDGRNTPFEQMQPGQARYGKVTLRFLALPASELAPWWQGVVDGQQDRRLITVALQSRDGEAVRTYHFHDCQILYYNPGDYDLGGSNQALEEVIVVQPGRVEIDWSSSVASASSGTSNQGGSTSSTSGGSSNGSGTQSDASETAGTEAQTPSTGETTSPGTTSGSTAPVPPRPPKTSPVVTTKDRPTLPTRRIAARSVSRDRKGTYYYYVNPAGKKLRVPITKVARVERLRTPAKGGVRFYLHLKLKASPVRRVRR